LHAQQFAAEKPMAERFLNNRSLAGVMTGPDSNLIEVMLGY